MLVKALSRQNIDTLTVEAARAASQAALDSLWKEQWITDSVTRRDTALARELKVWADDIRSRAGLVIIVAGREKYGIKAALDAVPGGEGAPEIIAWDGSLSPGDLAELIKKIDSVNTVMIAVSGGDEALEQRAAYAIIKQAIFAAHHDKEGEKVYAVCRRGACETAMDAEENVYPMTEYCPGTDECPGNSAAVLLPLMIKGADAEAYLGGFYDTVSAPDWDLDAAVPAYVMGLAGRYSPETGNEVRPEVFSWQRETRAMAEWFARMTGGDSRRMPQDGAGSAASCCAAGSALRILIAAENGHEDIMTPPFEGCGEDGSLEQLVSSEADREFFGGSEEDGIPGFKFCVEEADARSAGALIGYLQMILRLSGYFAGGLSAK